MSLNPKALAFSIMPLEAALLRSWGGEGGGGGVGEGRPFSGDL